MSVKDIESREDIDLLMSEFYEVAMTDDLIGRHFIDLNLEAHLPVIGNFWEKALFGRPVYFSNAMAVHEHGNQKHPMTPDHFARWVEIFVRTVDEHFAGEMADAAKMRARMVADSMNQRLNPELRGHALNSFRRSV